MSGQLCSGIQWRGLDHLEVVLENSLKIFDTDARISVGSDLSTPTGDEKIRHMT